MVSSAKALSVAEIIVFSCCFLSSSVAQITKCSPSEKLPLLSILQSRRQSFSWELLTLAWAMDLIGLAPSKSDVGPTPSQAHPLGYPASDPADSATTPFSFRLIDSLCNCGPQALFSEPLVTDSWARSAIPS